MNLLELFRRMSPDLISERNAVNAAANGEISGEGLLFEKGQVGVRPHMTPAGRELTFDRDNIQVYFPFSSDKTHVAMADAITGAVPACYGELTSVLSLLTLEERTLWESTRDALDGRPGFFDGDNLVATGLEMDPSSGVVMLSVLSAPYSFLRTQFPVGSPILDRPFYKTGALAVAVQDGKLVLMTRRADGMSSVASGFAQPIAVDVVSEETRKNMALINGKYDLVRMTATQELLEEALEDGRDGPLRCGVKVLAAAGVSIRTAGRSGAIAGTVEFPVPIALHGPEDFAAVAATPTARDAHEHIGVSGVLDVHATARDAMLEMLMGMNLPGVSLWGPAVIAAANAFGRPDKSVLSIGRFPGSRVHIVPAAVATPSVLRPPKSPFLQAWEEAVAGQRFKAAGSSLWLPPLKGADKHPVSDAEDRRVASVTVVP